MSVVKGEYEVIAPRLEYIRDEVILTQAWKKSHNYIRRYSWYADILELDCSIIDLENKLKEYATELSESYTYKPDPLRVVLAPKSHKWYFPNDKNNDKKNLWSPTKKKDDKEGIQPLRPLAHISIKDQTVSTAIMLCLADAIESAQGQPEVVDFHIAQQEEIYSYGNRLQCEWISHLNKRKRAKFSWGSSKSYRQYFDDYKAFLKRPHDVWNYYASILTQDKELYVVSLDISKFYNSIDLNALVEEMKLLYREYLERYKLSEQHKDEPEFWEKVKEVFNWEWAKTDYEQNNELITNEKSSLGLPQGLAAGGFFANAYLIRFDRKVGGFLKSNQKEWYEKNQLKSDIKVLDYCRYVDDIRLVVETSVGSNQEEVKKVVSSLIKSILKEHLQEIKSNKVIELNDAKASIVSYHQLSIKNNISAVMNNIQHGISGTPDADSLQQIIGELTGLLSMSNPLEEKELKKGNALELSRISLPYLDIRDDTLKRFSATRLVKTLKLKKSMTVKNEQVAVSEIDSKSITAGQILDHEIETVARKLISFWAENPSLSLLLKCGFELFPDVTLIRPVLEALELKLFDKTCSFGERKTAEYVISDLLRSAYTSIGYKIEYAYPENVNLVAFREELASIANKLLSYDYNFPWYVKQQAILYLIKNRDYGFTIEEEEEELNLYGLLLDASLYRTHKHNHVLKRFATSLIVQQLNPNKAKYATWFTSWLNNLDDDKYKYFLVELLLTNRPDLLREVLISDSKNVTNWKNIIPNNIKPYLKLNKNIDFNFCIKDPIPLINVIHSKNNPFKQENALLLLAAAILKDPESYQKLHDGRSVTDIKIKCKNWDEIQNPSYNGLEMEWIDEKDDISNKLFQPPVWVDGNSKWMYTLGSILRASMTGDYDFTTNTFLQREDIGIYKGIKSTRYTRKFSLVNHGKGLVEEPIPITPWLTELLYKLLSWPGIKIREVLINWKGVNSLGDLKAIIAKRLLYQQGIYGKLTRTPVYTLPVSKNPKNSESKIRFAVVQPLLPQVDDFNVKDPTKWDSLYREKHRDHVASICQLVNKQVKSTVNARKDLNENSFEGVDVIVFPELSIHPDDIELLRGLSDETNAHIFAGLTFIKPNYLSQPINQALWLLRSETATGREFKYVYQGKQHMTKTEKKMGIQPYRPYQVIIELENHSGEPIRIAGAICYDATDLAIAADLRDVSDVFIISAMNKDIQTFDNMVSYLHYHMYQPVILANMGEFGGSSVQAPFSKHQRTIAHVHGSQQIAISIFEIDPSIFKSKSKPKKLQDIKYPPAGYKGR